MGYQHFKQSKLYCLGKISKVFKFSRIKDIGR